MLMSEAHKCQPLREEEFGMACKGRGTTMKAEPRCLSVLIVDAEIDTAESMAILVRSNGHEAATAYTSNSALMEVKAKPPDVVIIESQLLDGGSSFVNTLLSQLQKRPVL